MRDAILSSEKSVTTIVIDTALVAQIGEMTTYNFTSHCASTLLIFNTISYYWNGWNGIKLAMFNFNILVQLAETS